MTSVLTVVESVYFQADTDIDSHSFNYEKKCLGDEQQVFKRNFRVGRQWQALEGCWVGVSSLVTISNEGTTFQRIPTEEELAIANDSGLEISLDGGETAHIEVGPKESCRFKPTELGKLLIRSSDGKSRCLVHVYPL